MTVRNLDRILAVIAMSNASAIAALLKITSEATITIDEGSMPAATASFGIARPTAAVEAMLQPGQPYMLRPAAGEPSSTSLLQNAWAWSFMITGYRKDAFGSVTISAASFDYPLTTYTPTVVDKGCWPLQYDVNAIWTYVLSKVYGGAQGDAGSWERQATDADPGVVPFRTYRGVTNLCTNSGFEYGTSPWTSVAATIAQDSSQKHGGTYSMRITPNATSDASRAELIQNLQPNTTYTLSAWIRTSAVMNGTGATNGRYIYLAGAVAGNTAVLAQTPAAPNVAGTWNRVAITFTTPALLDAGTFSLRVRNGTSTSNSVVMWVDDILLVEGDGLETDGTLVGYFDGDTVDGTAGYNYDWQGAAGSTSSVRTPITQRDQDALTWTPGQSAYDFLEPILQALDLRTFAFTQTEVGNYVNGAPPVHPLLALVTSQFSRRLGYSPIPDNQVAVVHGVNLYELDVTGSLDAQFPDGTPMYADAVILHYLWADNLGIEREAFDVYAPTAAYVKPWFVEYTDTPFPGAGRAQSLYRRLAARRQLITVTHRLRERIEPGVLMSVTSPAVGASGSVLGYVDTVTHDLIQARTTCRLKSAVDYPTYAWLRQPTGKRWTDIAAGVTWSTFTI